MERANAVRNAVESWRSGAKHGLLSRVVPHLTGEPAAGEVAGGEPFWKEPARAVPEVRKRRELWFEQAELWGGAAEPAAEAAPAAEAPAPECAATVEPAPRARGFALMADAPAPSKLSSTVRRERPVARRLDEVAKFLQVNDAVHGMRGGPELALPRGQFFARCSLWRGSRVGTPFLMGC